jgi:hypothetical protein
MSRKRERPAVDGRTTRHAGYAASQRVRQGIEEAFGWIKTIAGLRKASIPCTWDGFDEMDEASGDGHAELQDDGSITGEIAFHIGDKLYFTAARWTSSTAC